MKTWLLQWIKANSIMLVNAGSLVGTTAVTSVLGFVYWWLAARRFLPDDVGIASASVSAMMLLGGFCVLGLGTLLITELPRQPGREASLISTALLIVAAVGAVVAILFAVLAPSLSASLSPLRKSLLNILAFAAGVSLTSVTLVLDQACIGLLRGGLQLWRNTLFAIGKLTVLFIVSLCTARATGIAIYATWAAGNAISLLLFVAYILSKKSRLQRSYRPQWNLLHKLGLAAIQHHLLNLTLQAPTFILPLVVTALLSARVNAWFYVSWMIASFVFMVPTALTTVLHATNSAQPATLSHKARMTIGLSLFASILVNVFLQLDTRLALGFFGHSYVDQASWSLRILLLGAFPLIIKNHYISICRIQDRIAPAMLGMIPGGLLEIAAAIFGAHLASLSGLSIGWIAAIYVESIFMLPAVYKVIRSTSTSSERLNAQDYTSVETLWMIDTLVLPALPRSSHKVTLTPIPPLSYEESNQQDESRNTRLKSLPR